MRARRSSGSIALVLLAALALGCGAATAGTSRLAARPPDPAESDASFVTRIVRQDRADGWIQSDVEVGGLGRRVLRVLSTDLAVIEPSTAAVLDAEHIPQLMSATVDPSLDRLCVIAGDALDPRMGVFELSTRTWSWSHSVEPSGTPVAAIALADRCVGQFRGRDGDRLMAFDLATGEPRAIDAPPLDIQGEGPRRVSWSRDGTRRYDMRLAQSGSSTGWLVELRDGHTLASRQTFWANCVDVSAARDRVGFAAMESEERRTYLRSSVDAEWIDCAAPEMPADEPFDRPLPAPWAPLADGRLVHHDETGLWLVDWASRRSPERISEQPVLRYRDLDLRMRPLEPVVGESWVGIVDAAGDLVRFDLATSARIADVSLPGSPRDAQTAQWQVLAGGGERLFAARDVGDVRAPFVTTPDGWARVSAHTFIGTWQHADWQGTSWLLSDPHYGIYVVDPAGPTVTAAFNPPESYSRISRAVPSPDRARVAVIVGPWESDDAEGVYVLDAATLNVVARHPGQSSLYETREVLHWDERGIVVATRYAGIVVEPVWVAVDPQSGARTTLGAGFSRTSWGYRRSGDVHVFRSWHDDALVSVGAIDADATRISIERDGSSIETPDGHVWCQGSLCERFRCVTDAETIAPIDDPACAHLR